MKGKSCLITLPDFFKDVPRFINNIKLGAIVNMEENAKRFQEDIDKLSAYVRTRQRE